MIRVEKLPSALRSDALMEWLACAVALTFYFFYLRNSDLRWQGILVMGFFPVAAALLGVPSRTSSRAIILLAFSGVGILIAGILWSVLFSSYSLGSGFRQNVFRGVFLTAQAPLYGTRVANLSVRCLPALTLVAGLWLWLRSRGRAFNNPLRLQPVLAAIQILLTLGYALGESRARLFDLLNQQRRFPETLRQFEGLGLRDSLVHYVGRMPSLGMIASHYPPGNLLLFRLEAGLGWPHLVKTLGILSPTCALLLVFPMAHEVTRDRRKAVLAQVLFLGTAGPAIFATTCMDAFLLPLSAVALWLLARSLRQDRAWAEPLFLGVALAALTFISFSSLTLGLLLVLVLLWSLRERALPLSFGLRLISLVIGTYILCFLVAWLACGFDILACFRTALAQNLLLAQSGGFDVPIRYALRTSGNGIAYAISLGLPLLPLALLGAYWSLGPEKREGPVRFGGSPLARAFLTAGIGTIAIASASGMFFMETERVFLPLTPAIALASAVTLDELCDRFGERMYSLALLLLLFSSCFFGLLFRQHL